MRSTIHEMRNQLTVAVANIEAFLDGKLSPTPARLSAVLLALRELDVLFDRLRTADMQPGTAVDRPRGVRGVATDVRPAGTTAANDPSGVM